MNTVIDKITLDLTQPAHTPFVYAVQGETCTRCIKVSLLCNGTNWIIPENTVISVRYARMDGTGGYYDTLPDGTDSCSFEENTISVVLAPPMLSVSGPVMVQLEMIYDHQLLSTFVFHLIVKPSLTSQVITPDNYIHWLQWMEQTLNEYIEKYKMSGEYTGGTMSGSINMSGHAITGLIHPTSNDQAANMSFVNQQVKKSAPHNYLDNSDFRNPVNQRGHTTYEDAGYTIDRWKLDVGGMTVSVENRYIKLLPLGAYNMAQHIGDLKYLQGKHVTFTLKADGDLNFIIGCSINGSMTYQNANKYDGLYVGNYVIPENAEQVSIFIQPQNTNECRLYWAALYEGDYTIDSLPGYQPKGYGAELAECQRYYVGPINFMLTKIASLSLEETCILPVSMHTTPTAPYPTAAIFSNNGTAGHVSVWLNNNWEDYPATVSMLDNRSVRLSIYGIDINSTCQCTITVSADIL